jgi:predicted GNAT family acetyltransferase
MADGLPVLYQAEWCPFSSAVREVLTELGIDFVARHVEPWPKDRAGLRALAGSDLIPVLEAPDGQLFRGTRAIFDHLRTQEPWAFAAAHRRRFAAHADARVTDVAAQLLEYFRETDELEQAPSLDAEPVVVHVPEAQRYELRLDGRLVGLLAYRPRDGVVVMTHTEVDPSCSGRGWGTRLVLAALEDVRAAGLAVVPLCPFVAAVIRRHPAYRDLVADD